MNLSVIALLLTLAPPAIRAEKYTPPRPVFSGFHIAMSEDSAFLLMRQLALRHDTLHMDSVLLLESDSIEVFGQPAYVELQILHHRVRTIVINWFPLGGNGYVGLREVLLDYMERYFGDGVAFKDETLTYQRWETEDGTSELSYSDKYMRIFLRLGKPR